MKAGDKIRIGIVGAGRNMSAVIFRISSLWKMLRSSACATAPQSPHSACCRTVFHSPHLSDWRQLVLDPDIDAIAIGTLAVSALPDHSGCHRQRQARDV